MTDNSAGIGLGEELEGMLARSKVVPLYGYCSCDGYSIGHARGCEQTQVGTRIVLSEDDAREIGNLLPVILAALRDRQPQQKD